MTQEMQEDLGDQGGGGEPDYESEARAEGWRPKEQFKGDPDKWIDAKTFVERGREVLPLIKAKNKRLEQQLAEHGQTLAEMRKSMDEYRAHMEATTQTLSKQAKEAYAKAEADLRAARKAALRDGDTDRFEELDDALGALKKEGEKVAAAPPPKQVATTAGGNIIETAEFRSWAAENKWFGVDEDKSAYAVAQGQLIRQKNPSIPLDQFFTEIGKRVEKIFGKETATREETSKVEGARRTGSSGGKGYADMPSDARAQCDADCKKFVGANKVYKTEAEYRKFFASAYFSE